MLALERKDIGNGKRIHCTPREEEDCARTLKLLAIARVCYRSSGYAGLSKVLLKIEREAVVRSLVKESELTELMSMKTEFQTITFNEAINSHCQRVYNGFLSEKATELMVNAFFSFLKQLDVRFTIPFPRATEDLEEIFKPETRSVGLDNSSLIEGSFVFRILTVAMYVENVPLIRLINYCGLDACLRIYPLIKWCTKDWIKFDPELVAHVVCTDKGQMSITRDPQKYVAECEKDHLQAAEQYYCRNLKTVEQLYDILSFPQEACVNEVKVVEISKNRFRSYYY